MSIRRRSDRAVQALARVLLAVAALCLATPARADDDDLAAYRDRFRLGMEKYKAGAVSEAIRVWSAIYEELGPKRGYRLAFNLARAYDTYGEATRAAERYRAFLDEAQARRTAGEQVEPLVEREVYFAQERMTDLDRGHGRIQVDPGADATLAQVDDTDPRLGAFTAYVAPGRHIVTFGPGKPGAETVDVTVAAGELVVTHATPHVTPPAPILPPSAFDPVLNRVTKHPFSPVVLYGGAVATAASVVAPVLAYKNARSIYATAESSVSTPTQAQNAIVNYSGARTLAYGMLALPISLGAITGGLATWYFTGAQERTVVLSFDAAPALGGGSAELSARF